MEFLNFLSCFIVSANLCKQWNMFHNCRNSIFTMFKAQSCKILINTQFQGISQPVEENLWKIEAIKQRMTYFHENNLPLNIYQPQYEATPNRLTGVFKLMLRWTGSVLNLIYHSFIIFVILYFLLSFLYRFVFIHNPYQKETFEVICIYADRLVSIKVSKRHKMIYSV